MSECETHRKDGTVNSDKTAPTARFAATVDILRQDDNRWSFYKRYRCSHIEIT
jgi:hypothetical protein